MRKSILISFVCIAITFNGLFAQKTVFVVRDIVISGNNKTKAEIILRECPMSISDTLSLDEINKVLTNFNNNLVKTSLFNFVNTNYSINADSVIILVSVEERWYLWPFPILEYADRNLSSYFHNRDYARLNYGVALDLYNFRGQNDLLKFKIRMGYKEHYSIAWHKNALGENRKAGANFQVDYFRQKSTESQIVGNKPIFVTDLDNYIRKSFITGVNLIVRPGYNSFFNLGIKFQNTVLENNVLFPEINIESDHYKSNYLKPYFYFKYDSRDNKVYPVNGTLVSAFIGFNQSLDSGLGSYFIFNIKAQYNHQIGKSRFSLHIEPSYSFLKTIADANILFDNKLEFSHDFWIRGYEYYYFTVPQFFNLQNTFSYKLRDFKIHKLPAFLPDEFSKSYSRIYLDIFLDYAYSSPWKNEVIGINPISDRSIYSTGLGLSFETYYDRLFQIYFVYSGYLAKTGIFVNYKTPIYKLY